MEMDQDISDSFINKSGLFSITGAMKAFKCTEINKSQAVFDKYGETTSAAEALDTKQQLQQLSKSVRKRRVDRTSAATNNSNNNGPITMSSTTSSTAALDYAIHNNNNNNNNNHVKNERLSPGTPDTSSRSRSVTPSSASHPDTPPAPENHLLPVTSRNYSDFMRSLAAKYNNANPNDYFSAARNGFPPPLDPRFKAAAAHLPNFLPNLSIPNNKDSDLTSNSKKPAPDFSSVLNPFTGAPMFAPLIDMSSTQALLAMVRTAKEAELQGLLKNVKRQDPSSPLDLSAAAPPIKRPRIKTPSSNSPSGGVTIQKRSESESPIMHEDVSHWSVDDVCNFVSSIDICAEYAQTFRNQRIDGSGLPLLTEEHLTSTMNMKLGPALKLRSILAKKLGSCGVCLHCSHCHNTGSPEPATITGNTSDSGGTS